MKEGKRLTEPLHTLIVATDMEEGGRPARLQRLAQNEGVMPFGRACDGEAARGSEERAKRHGRKSRRRRSISPSRSGGGTSPLATQSKRRASSHASRAS